ncbi:vacuolar segregation subunit 7-domain-containing protein [Podospora australis]|uniref:Vacuolar segregation subunit 7-domain-containing protein n=1 Tax=Podospora australis TaxID=1536484 RepID=A0AAN7AI27_9PEZI|nr:vacuolar segregation subunit 7-domain-containing protein [Podospora australis]
MDKSPSMPTTGPSSSSVASLHPTLSRESTASTATITPKTDSWPSKLTSQTSAVSAASSAAPSPLQSREPSPTRPLHRSNSRASSINAGTRSRKNSQQDLSPSRTAKQQQNNNPPVLPPTSTSAARTLSSSNTPTLLPSLSDPSSNAGAPPVKSPTSMEHLRESPRWPISPRLRSPPPILHRPNIAPGRRAEIETPLIALQRATPPQPQYQEPQSDTDTDDAHIPSGLRTPARGGGGSTSTLETVQEVSPLGSPRGPELSLEETMADGIMSETSQSDHVGLGLSNETIGRSSAVREDSGSESGSIKAERRGGNHPVPSLTTRRSSASVNRAGASKGKTGDGSLQSMTVETETVKSIPQAALVPGVGTQASSVSLRTKNSNETIRPKKKEKKPTRKQPSVTAVNGEKPYSVSPPTLRHHISMFSVFSQTEKRISPPESSCSSESVEEPLPHWLGPRRRGNSTHSVFNHHWSHMSNLLTRQRAASSKADIFEAKVASAVEEANSSDSEETFVYDSNPPDARERPPRFHSRTPSATSMASQIDRTGMRSIHTVLENAGPQMVVKKSMKFVNTYNSNVMESMNGEDDGKGTSRSNAGSARSTARHHHHFGRWGRNGGGNGHPSLFAEHSPFGNSINTAHGGSRHSSNPPSPRYAANRGLGLTSKRSTHLSAGYDLDDNTTGADDETTPLIQSSTIRSSRSGRGRRGASHSMRNLESQSYRAPPSVLNRFASCLVLTVMLLLVVSGAIGFMFATSQPLTDLELTAMSHVVASQQELMFDLTIRAHNPNIVVVSVDAADIEVFAQSPHALSDSEWWRHTHPGEVGPPPPRKGGEGDIPVLEASSDEETSPVIRLGSISTFDAPFSFEGSFFRSGISNATGGVRIRAPGNGTYGGPERWERIIEDEFLLVLKGVVKYTLPLSQRERSADVHFKKTIKPHSADDPVVDPTPTPTPEKPSGEDDDFTIS